MSFSQKFFTAMLLGFFVILTKSFGQESVVTLLDPARGEVLEIEKTQKSEASKAALATQYHFIARRNPFNLQAPKAPPPKIEEEPKEELSLEELQITLAGVSAKNGERRVWLSMSLPSAVPAQKPLERFFGFREGEQQHGLTVKTIAANGNVEIEYDGAPHLLTFKTHGNKKKAKAKPNVPLPRPPSRALSSRSRSGSVSRSRVPAPNASPRSPSRSTSSSRIPSRPVRTQAQPRFSRDEQILILNTQKILAEKEGRPFPPVPDFTR